MGLAHGRPTKEIRDLAVAFGIFYDKERLEREKSTENQSVRIEIVKFTRTPAEAGLIELEGTAR